MVFLNIVFSLVLDSVLHIYHIHTITIILSSVRLHHRHHLVPGVLPSQLPSLHLKLSLFNERILLDHQVLPSILISGEEYQQDDISHQRDDEGDGVCKEPKFFLICDEDNAGIDGDGDEQTERDAEDFEAGNAFVPLLDHRLIQFVEPPDDGLADDDEDDGEGGEHDGSLGQKLIPCFFPVSSHITLKFRELHV